MLNAESFILTCKQKYYEGSPIISDSEYDYLVSIYGEPNTGYRDGNYMHYSRMYSLQKYYEGEDDFPSYGGKTVKTFKYDGAAVSLLYTVKDDKTLKLSLALTRGDGEFGDDITDNILQIKAIPKTIPKLNGSDVVQITGEILARKEIPNARNYAAGALKLKDKAEVAKRDLYFKAYGIFPAITNSYIQDMTVLEAINISTVLVDDWAFPTDGWVVRIDNNIDYEEQGFTAKHPRGAYAIKQRNKGVETTIIDVVWQTGKSGKITPVAILSPVNIDGAIVSRATLNNIEYINALDIEIGSKVLVERAGGIIPRIIGVV
jgi:DNA ligase (NAD+)